MDNIAGTDFERTAMLNYLEQMLFFRGIVFVVQKSSAIDNHHFIVSISGDTAVLIQNTSYRLIVFIDSEGVWIIHPPCNSIDDIMRELLSEIWSDHTLKNNIKALGGTP